MQRCDPKQPRSELTLLIEKQLEILEKEMTGEVTDAELREYEEREERIDELKDALHCTHPAAELRCRITIEPAWDCDGSLCHQPLADESGMRRHIAPHSHLVKWEPDGSTTSFFFVIFRRGN